MPSTAKNATRKDKKMSATTTEAYYYYFFPPHIPLKKIKMKISLILHSQSHPADAMSHLLYLWNLLTYPTDLLQTPMKILQSTFMILPYLLWTLCSATLHFRS